MTSQDGEQKAISTGISEQKVIDLSTSLPPPPTMDTLKMCMWFLFTDCWGDREEDRRNTTGLPTDRKTFFHPLLLDCWPPNVKEVLAANGVKILVDFLTLAHLHTSRATVPLQVRLFSKNSEIFSSPLSPSVNPVSASVVSIHPRLNRSNTRALPEVRLILVHTTSKYKMAVKCEQ